MGLLHWITHQFRRCSGFYVLRKDFETFREQNLILRGQLNTCQHSILRLHENSNELKKDTLECLSQLKTCQENTLRLHESSNEYRKDAAKYLQICQRSMLDVQKLVNDLKNSTDAQISIITDKLTELDSKVNSLISRSQYEILPGTPYSRYAIPLDYLPSQEFTPRWGYEKAVYEPVQMLLARYTDSYQTLLSRFTSLHLEHIPLQMTDEVINRERRFIAGWLGGAMTALDKLGVYAMIALHRPKRYYEIGSGISTYFAKAAKDFYSIDMEMASIDPNPRAEIKGICDRVHEVSLECMDPSYFHSLEAGDVLFFDGSHRIFTNSDVTVFFLEVLPRIKPGVIIHLHDIFLPWDYPERFLNWYWNEQYMLALYLTIAHNQITPLLPMWYICHSDNLAPFLHKPFIDLDIFDSGDDTEQWRVGGSFWFTKNDMSGD